MIITHERLRPLTSINQIITKSIAYDFIIQELQLNLKAAHLILLSHHSKWGKAGAAAWMEEQRNGVPRGDKNAHLLLSIIVKREPQTLPLNAVDLG